jgi:hypothetical protein
MDLSLIQMATHLRFVGGNLAKNDDENLTVRLRKNLEVLTVDNVVLVHQLITGGFHFAPNHVSIGSVAEQTGREPTRMIVDYRGGPLAQMKVAKTFSTEHGRKSYAAGQNVSCYDCHNGPKP